MEAAAQPERADEPEAPGRLGVPAQPGAASRPGAGPEPAPAPSTLDGGSPAPASGPAAPSRFNVRTVLLLSGAHFIHDAYPAFTGVMLPLLIDKLSLTIGQAGLMATGIRWTTMLQVPIGYLADRVDSRFLVIAAPAVTAICISSIGLAPSFFAVFALLLLAGLSHAAFHPASAAVVTRISGGRWGRGMSYYMTGGELGRALGPLYIAAILTAVGLAWSWIAVIPGIVASALLYGRLRGASAVRFRHPSGAVRESLARSRRGLVPLSLAIAFRSVAHNAIAVFVPTFAVLQGADIAYAGGAVAAYEVGGTLGAFAGGILSDRFGRRSVLAWGLALGVPALVGALYLLPGPAQLVVLGLGGFCVLSASAVHLVAIQELLPDNRSLATGIFYFVSSAASIATMIGVGALADQAGLLPAMVAGLGIAALALPAILLLPGQLAVRGRGQGH
jgi:FSR family fosmidomycin resistance protein-like MFS transporter